MGNTLAANGVGRIKRRSPSRLPTLKAWILQCEFHPGDSLTEVDLARRLRDQPARRSAKLLTAFRKKAGCLKFDTQAPTAALEAVAPGHAGSRTIPFHMPYIGRENYHYVADVGAHFASCALDAYAGLGVLAYPQMTVEVEEFLALINKWPSLSTCPRRWTWEIARYRQYASVCDLDDRTI